MNIRIHMKELNLKHRQLHFEVQHAPAPRINAISEVDEMCVNKIYMF